MPRGTGVPRWQGVMQIGLTAAHVIALNASSSRPLTEVAVLRSGQGFGRLQPHEDRCGGTRMWLGSVLASANVASRRVCLLVMRVHAASRIMKTPRSPTCGG